MSDPFYALYKDAGWVPKEILCNGIIASICFVGICLNASIVYVTAKSKSLHHPCNILIALYAFFACFLLLGFTIKFFVFLFAFNYIQLGTCFYLQIVPLACTVFSVCLQLCIAFDRFIGVLLPVWYQLYGKKLIFKLMLLASMCHVTYNVYIYCSVASLHWNQQIMCTMGEPVTVTDSELENEINLITLVIYTTELILYAMIWVITLLWRKSQISQLHKKLMLSLSIIMGIGLFCYAANLIFTQYILPTLGLHMFTIEYVVMPISFIAFCSAYGSIAPVLFLCSEQYANAFRTCFGQAQQQQQNNVVRLMRNNVVSNVSRIEMNNSANRQTFE